MDHLGNETYLVHETLKFGFIPFSFTYPATIEKCTMNNTVTIMATIFKLTKIEIFFALKADNGCTIIEEEVHFKSPLPVVFFMESIFQKLHGKLFRQIEAA
jgi:hypothetical protein